MIRHTKVTARSFGHMPKMPKYAPAVQSPSVAWRVACSSSSKQAIRCKLRKACSSLARLIRSLRQFGLIAAAQLLQHTARLARSAKETFRRTTLTTLDKWITSVRTVPGPSEVCFLLSLRCMASAQASLAFHRDRELTRCVRQLEYVCIRSTGQSGSIVDSHAERWI